MAVLNESPSVLVMFGTHRTYSWPSALMTQWLTRGQRTHSTDQHSGATAYLMDSGMRRSLCDAN